MRNAVTFWTLGACLVLVAGCAGKSPADAITGVAIEPPANGPAGDKAVVCWTVEGKGRAPHVALHWSNRSQASKPGRTFADYSLGAAYPNNASALEPAGYALPARFCTGVTVPPQGTLYIVGHAMGDEGPPGRISEEVTLQPLTGQVAEVGTPTGPSAAAANSDVELCWLLRGNGTLSHVDVHWAYESQAGKSDRSFRSYDKGSAYPDNAAGPDPRGYAITPDGTEYCANVRMPASGLVFVVAHVLDQTGEPGLLSGEKSVGVE